MGILLVKQRITVRLRQLNLMSNIHKEIAWLHSSEDEYRESLGLGGELGWYDEGPLEDKLRNLENVERFHVPVVKEHIEINLGDEAVRTFRKREVKRIDIVPDPLKVIDLDMAQESIPCFGNSYRACKIRKECRLSGLCKQESSKMRAHQKHGAQDKYVQLADNKVEGTSKVRVDKAFDKVSDEQLERWKRSNRPQYLRYLVNVLFNERERIALQFAMAYESRVKKIIRKPFYVVLGNSGDVEKHKNWEAFLRVADRILEEKASTEQYLEAQFHFSHSRTGYPPLNSLGSVNSAKKYREYTEKVVKQLGTKMVAVWECKDEAYKLEMQLQEMWQKIQEDNPYLFPSKDFYLFHGMELGINNTDHFTEEYLMNKYPGELYDIVKDNYYTLLQQMRETLPKVYLKDMSKPSLYSYIY